MRAVEAASVRGALPAVVSHAPTLRTAPVDIALTDYVRADSQISKNGKVERQGCPMSVRSRELTGGGAGFAGAGAETLIGRPKVAP